MEEHKNITSIDKPRRKKRDQDPTYVKIAQDIAHRIANGDIHEGKRLSGRSIMSSEYGVSPETIRRSFSLLEDMKVVSVHQNSGVVVKSKENASRYVERNSTRDKRRELLKRMHEIYKSQKDAYEELMDLTNSLVDSTEHFIASNPFYTYECSVPEHSPCIGKTLSALNFWQITKATVIAIRRQYKILLSPGPDEPLKANDMLVIVGRPDTKESVFKLLQS
ncbi:MAG: TrkA C-terminal domain-containing protein [Sphaerochaetaceae bacterium]